MKFSCDKAGLSEAVNSVLPAVSAKSTMAALECILLRVKKETLTVVGYNTEPRQQASGLPLEVAGNAYLEVMIQGTPMGMLSQREDLIKAGPMDVAAGSILGVTHGGVFEADTQYILGVDQQRPFRAYTLENPTRLVIDVQR